MDLDMKQWRFHHEQKQKHQKQQDESDLEQQQQQQPTGPTPSGPDSALPLFVPEITNNSLPLFPPPTSSTTTTTKMMMMMPSNNSYFSLTQWQELELQALIYKHMLAGAAVPPQLLHLLNKTLLRSSLPFPLQHPFHQYPHYQSPLLQASAAGHWGRPGGPMDPEPGRCRRTDGKKWRCSKDVVAAHKYCDRHMHRGRNRSRKPVETSSSSSATTANSLADSPTTTAHLNQNRRTLEVGTEENKGMFGMQNEVAVVSKELKPAGDRVLRHFFDDWPRPPLHQTENSDDTGPVTLSTSTNVSDFSLKLATGHEDDTNNNTERDLNQLNWASGWRGAGPMGGPLAEALRTSTTDSSPTSVLHHLARHPN
ncbi:growth-regulating factor 3-like [Impatiens glandulifera]|uniref:growth-regulating factor 3-like n=1 Tax=Impatiens glandulifera TaxID=253017 RepID=UPI001FB0C8B1|nr:growth-regulating factor 3-like [Impatiens glandulifera]